MALSPLWEANRFLASQEIPCISWYPEGSLPRSQEPATCLSHIISFISVDPYSITNPYGYGKWSHQYKMYKYSYNIWGFSAI
jgi:hypothetical protein